MKWIPFGKKSKSYVEGFRRGCGGTRCIHVKVDISMTPKEAEKLCKIIMKAIDYANGGRK